MTSELDDARDVERALRARLAETVTERARAEREAGRLDGRAALSGADPAVAEAAVAQRRLAARAAATIESLRAELRQAEGRVARLEAAADEGRGDDAGGAG